MCPEISKIIVENYKEQRADRFKLLNLKYII